MADIAGIYALGAALGAAGIGAVAGGLLQRAKGRQDIMAVELQRRHLEEDRRQLSTELALEANASARSAGRAWLSGVQRMLQEVEVGRVVDIGRFDEEFNQLQSELTQSMYRLATTTTAVPQSPAGASTSVHSYIEQIAEITLLIRSDLLRAAAGLPPVHDSSDLRSLAALVGAELHAYAQRRIERLLESAGRVQCLEQVRASSRVVEGLRSQLASARADEALHALLQQTATAHDQALASVQERIEAHRSVGDLEASLRDAEQAWAAGDAWAIDERERLERQKVLMEEMRRELELSLGAGFAGLSVPPDADPRVSTADATLPTSEKPGRADAPVADDGE
ncbi:hypothetical protein AB0M32_36110 [Streptomyces sp. NPDC051985]|uniref:hypothetical protein n=1 Tax=Streptomyces sp. NPDC051985 TaxID=3155807 RepID=UPI003415D3F2